MGLQRREIHYLKTVGTYMGLQRREIHYLKTVGTYMGLQRCKIHNTVKSAYREPAY